MMSPLLGSIAAIFLLQNNRHAAITEVLSYQATSASRSEASIRKSSAPTVSPAVKNNGK